MNQPNELLEPLNLQKGEGPKISIIVPVKNEESVIVRCLSHVRETALRYATEIIVVDGGSTDNTVLLARNLADQVLLAPKPGRSAQMHWGAKKATGDLFLFLHADTLLPRNWQAVLEKCFFGSKIHLAGGAFHLGFDRTDFPYDVIAGLANFRTHITGVPQGDQTLFVRKEAYALSGGYPDVELMEEYVFVPRLRKVGEFRVFSAEVTTSSRRFAERGPIRNALRNSFIVLLHYLGASPQTLARYYR